MVDDLLSMHKNWLLRLTLGGEVLNFLPHHFHLLLYFQRETGSLDRFKASLSENVLGSPKELVKLSVPSLVYAIQNNMAFLALSNLDAAVYQVSAVNDIKALN